MYAAEVPASAGITVILEGFAEGMTEPEIMDHYPQLTKNDIHACLALAMLICAITL